LVSGFTYKNMELPTYTSQIDLLPPSERADYAKYINFILSWESDPEFDPELYLWHETIIVWHSQNQQPTKRTLQNSHW
jgi:hypothetical protein